MVFSDLNDITDKHLLILAYDFINRELVTFKNNRGHDSLYIPTLAEICDAAARRRYHQASVPGAWAGLVPISHQYATLQGARGPGARKRTGFG